MFKRVVKEAVVGSRWLRNFSTGEHVWPRFVHSSFRENLTADPPRLEVEKVFCVWRVCCRGEDWSSWFS